MPRRYTQYSESVADHLIELISGGASLKAAAAAAGVCAMTLNNWQNENKGGFRDRLAEARRTQAERLVDEILTIADECPLNAQAIARAALQIRSRQWVIERLHPKTFVPPMAPAPQEEMVPIDPAAFLRQWQAKNPPQEVN